MAVLLEVGTEDEPEHRDEEGVENNGLRQGEEGRQVEYQVD